MKVKLTKVIQLLAAITLTCFIALGMLLVLVQLFAVVTLNGTLATSLVTMKGITIIISVVLGFLSLILSYMTKSKKAEN